ncbi:low affinity iron permease family protein [Runella sp.]|uniref:low affinity iron permease family protein n=1 Tax=Runella sp. TaxID=1960881 RepID=UPI003D0A3CEC
MKKSSQKQVSGFEKISIIATKAAGSTSAFIVASLLIVGWLASGPLFDYSDTWQLVINTSTTIVTFLMVFLIQRSQNKESMAIHLKLNELISANQFTSNRLVCVEDLTEDELKVLQKFYNNLAALTEKDESMQESHSIEEAEDLHKFKKKLERKAKTEPA